MHVVVLTVGSRGDVQPYTALGVELTRSGHHVTLATHEPFRGLVTDHGLTFAALAGDPRVVLHSEEAADLLASGRSTIRFAGRFLRVLKPWFADLAEATETLVAAADVVVYSPLAFTGWHQPRRRGFPPSSPPFNPSPVPAGSPRSPTVAPIWADPSTSVPTSSPSNCSGNLSAARSTAGEWPGWVSNRSPCSARSAS